MPRSKTDKTKKTKVSKKFKTPHSKITKRSAVKPIKKESEVLLSTELGSDSITHGHTPYHHALVDLHSKKNTERTQRLIMYVGVSSIMVIIVFFWILSLKSTLGPDSFSVNSSTDSQTKSEFENLKNDLTKTLSEVKGEIKSLEELAQEAPTQTANPGVITTTATPEIISETAKPNLPQTLPN